MGSSHTGTQPSQAQPNGAATAERNSPCLVVGHTIAGNGLKEAWRPWWLSCGNAVSLAAGQGFQTLLFFQKNQESRFGYKVSRFLGISLMC